MPAISCNKLIAHGSLEWTTFPIPLSSTCCSPSHFWLMSGFNPSWQYWAIVDRVEHGQTSTEIKKHTITHWLTCFFAWWYPHSLVNFVNSRQLNKEDVGSVPWFFAKHPFRPINFHAPEAILMAWQRGWVCQCCKIQFTSDIKWPCLCYLLWGHGVWGMVIWT